MSLTFACGQCGKTFTIDERFAGKKGKCKQCGAVMMIPAAGPAPSSALRAMNRAEASPSRRAATPSDREISPSRRASTQSDREPSPLRRPPKPGRAPEPDIFGFDEAPLPPKSAVMELDEDDFEPVGTSYPYPRSAGIYDPTKKKKKGSSAESAGFLIFRIFLGLGIGSAGMVASAVFLLGMPTLSIPSLPSFGWESTGDLEELLKERIALNRELSSRLDTIDDVPAALAASGEVNQKLNAITANLNKLRTAKGLRTQKAEALGRQYLPQMNQATHQLLQSFLRVARMPAVYNALNANASLQALDQAEKSFPGLSQASQIPNIPIPGPSRPPAMPPNFNPPTQPGMPYNPGTRNNRSGSRRGTAPRPGQSFPPGSLGPG